MFRSFVKIYQDLVVKDLDELVLCKILILYTYLVVLLEYFIFTPESNIICRGFFKSFHLINEFIYHF